MRRVQKRGIAGQSARAATYKISIYRIFPLQWGLMSVILPGLEGRKVGVCDLRRIRFREEAVRHFQPRKYLERDTRGSIIFEFVWKEREESSFLLSLALVNEKVNEESRGGESRDLL